MIVRVSQADRLKYKIIYQIHNGKGVLSPHDYLPVVWLTFKQGFDLIFFFFHDYIRITVVLRSSISVYAVH